MKSHRYSRASFETLGIFVAHLSGVAGSLCLLKVLTTYTDPNQFGAWALCLTIVSVSNQTIFGGLSTAIGRYFPIARALGALSQYIKSCRYAILTASSIVIVVGLIFIIFLTNLNLSSWLYVALSVIVLSLVNGLISCLSAIQIAVRAHRSSLIYPGLNPWLVIVFFIMTISLNVPTVLGIVLSYVLSSITLCTIQFFITYKLISCEFAQVLTSDSTNWTRKIFSLCLPISFFGIFTWLQQSSDKWMLQHFSALEEVGQYAVLYQLGFAPCLLFIGVVSQQLGPIIYQITGDATDQSRTHTAHALTWRVVLYSLLFTAMIFSLCLIIHHQLFVFFVSDQYWSTSYLLPWLILAGGLFGSAQLLALKTISEIKIRVTTIIKVVTSLVGLVLNSVGAYFWGIEGVVGALVIFTLTYLLSMAWYTRLSPMSRIIMTSK